MGQKTHPVGFRLGVIREWDAKWFAERDYTKLLHEDIEIRKLIKSQLKEAGIPRIEIERSVNQVTIGIHAAKPGIVIGRGGARVEELRKVIETRTGKKVRINIVEVRQPETNATLIAESIADQLRRRVAYKRAMKQAVNRAMQRGAKGTKIVVAGRLGGAEMCRRERELNGKVPLHTLRADIDYGQAEALTTFGLIGIKVWVYHGEVLPEIKKERIVPMVETKITPVAKPAPEGPGASPTDDMTANRTE